MYNGCVESPSQRRQGSPRGPPLGSQHGTPPVLLAEDPRHSPLTHSVHRAPLGGGSEGASGSDRAGAGLVCSCELLLVAMAAGPCVSTGPRGLRASCGCFCPTRCSTAPLPAVAEAPGLGGSHWLEERDLYLMVETTALLFPSRGQGCVAVPGETLSVPAVLFRVLLRSSGR